MSNNYGKNIILILEDNIYKTTKVNDTDGDDTTSSSRLSTEQKFMVRDLLVDNLRILQEKADIIIKSLADNDDGVVTLLLQPVQFAAIMLAVQEQVIKLLDIQSYNAQVANTVIDVATKANIR